MARFEDSFPPYVPFGSRTLRASLPPLSGTDVAVLQALLVVASSVIPRLSPPPAITGSFDETTRDAVRRFQAHFGIQPTGEVTPDTYFLFGQGVGPHTTYGGPVYGSRSLAEGAQGGDVIVLQNRLALFHYAPLLGGPADGIFGPRTAAALRRFKEDAQALGDTGLSPDAVAGPGAFDATWIYTFAGGRGLFPGRNGLDVAFVQALLAELGLLNRPPSGFYDEATRAAVAAFQRREGIPVDGAVGPTTYYHLGLRTAHTPPAPFPIAWPPRAVVVSSGGLAPQGTSLHPYGVASIVVNTLEGFESLDVTANLLPPPSSFGPAYGQYAFTFTDDSGRLLFRALLVELPGGDQEADWGGSVSVGVATIPSGTVTIYPTPAGAAEGPYGPKVLEGHVSQPNLGAQS